MRATPETDICRAYLKVVTSSDPSALFLDKRGERNLFVRRALEGRA